MEMDGLQKEHGHGSGIRHSQAAIAARVPRCPRDFPPSDAPVGNLSGPLCAPLLPPGTRSPRPYLCLLSMACGLIWNAKTSNPLRIALDKIASPCNASSAG